MSPTEQKLEQDLQQALLERSIATQKFQITSGVLHDIGNALVGLGSYLNRIRRSVEQYKPDNLQNLAGFFVTQQTAMTAALGSAKADALVSMLNNMVGAQTTHRDEIINAITEQTNIISHIQEILHIQRQYVNGQDMPENKPISLGSIVTDCLSMQSASMEKRGIIVTKDISGELPLIKGDRTRLMQVVLNLLKNSMEAIDIAGREKRISIRLFAQDDLLTLQIQDSGSGFDEATGKQLFSRGFTTKAAGTGLGLNNCRAIIEGHSGTITISSEGPGKGALAIINFKL